MAIVYGVSCKHSPAQRKLITPYRLKVCYTRFMSYNFPVIITQDKNGMYVAYVPSLKGCHTQAKSLATLHKRLPEAIELCLEVERSKKHPIPQVKFIALEHIEVDL